MNGPLVPIPPFLFTVTSYDELANSIDTDTIQLHSAPGILYFTTTYEKALCIADCLSLETRLSILKVHSYFFAHWLQPLRSPGYWTLQGDTIHSISKKAIVDITMLPLTRRHTLALHYLSL